MKKFILIFLIITACQDKKQEVKDTSVVDKPVVAKPMKVQTFEKQSYAMNSTVGEENKLVREWMGEILYSTACNLDKSKCKFTDQELDDFEDMISDKHTCLICSGWHKPTGSDACEVFCDIKKAPLKGETSAGCICGSKQYEWVRDHCQNEPCEQFGFVWIKNSKSWALPLQLAER